MDIFSLFSPPFVGMVYDASTQNANEIKHFTKTVDVFMLLLVELIFFLEYIVEDALTPHATSYWSKYVAQNFWMDWRSI